jgi:hypothetical protein
MKRAKRSRDVPTNLSLALQHRLSKYALAAGAAGVTLLALPQSSQAEVVYTPANETIGRLGKYNLDLNQDGITDFILAEQDASNGLYQQLSAKAAAGNQVNCESEWCISGDSYAAALRFGSQIGPSHTRGWMAGNVPMALEALNRGGSVYYGDAWANVSDRYLGLLFKINGETHYGWARLSVKFHGGPVKVRSWEAHLTGYAYETVANQPMTAGQIKSNDDNAENSTSSAQLKPLTKAQVATLGMLAVGADGLTLWRREEREHGGSPQNQ